MAMLRSSHGMSASGYRLGAKSCLSEWPSSATAPLAARSSFSQSDGDFPLVVRFAPEAANQEWHWVGSWRIFSSLPLSPLSSKPLGKSCWRPGKEPIGGTDRPEDLSEQSFDCDPPDRQSETSLADLDAR